MHSGNIITRYQTVFAENCFTVKRHLFLKPGLYLDRNTRG